MPVVNDYTYYENAMNGKYGTVTETDYMVGFYKTKKAVPVAIFHDSEGVPHMLEGDEEVGDNRQSLVWMSCCTRAISEDEYNKLLWPTNDGVDALYSPLPDTTPEALTERLREMTQISTQITDDHSANILADLLRLSTTVLKRAEDQMKADKKPHDDAAAKAKSKWDEAVSLAKKLKEDAISSLTPWMEEDGTRKPKGQIGNAVSLRETTSLEIVDEPKLLRAFYKEAREEYNEAVKAAAIKWAKSELKKKDEDDNPIIAPGCDTKASYKAQ